MNSSVRICVVGEWLHGLPDEGIHNLAQKLSDQWSKVHPVSIIRIGTDFPVNRFFLSFKLRRLLQDIRPDLIYYISPSCSKIAALFRAKILKAYYSQARVFVVASQPVAYTPLERSLLSRLAPDGIFIQSPHSKELLEGLRCPVFFLPSGVDLGRFVPVGADQKKALRKHYGVDENSLVVLHVGHVRPNRNVQLLSDIAQLRKVQVLLVGSTSTPPDETLIRQLIQMDVLVVRNFIPCIEEMYQLADIYLFPVISEHAAIGVPLSVLEAMACNLPVITTHFGGLPQMFDEGEGLFYFKDASELPELIKKAEQLTQCSTRQMVESYSWDSVARKAVAMAQGKDDPIWN